LVTETIQHFGMLDGKRLLEVGEITVYTPARHEAEVAP
jgi:hypothetical protein